MKKFRKPLLNILQSSPIEDLLGTTLLCGFLAVCSLSCATRPKSITDRRQGQMVPEKVKDDGIKSNDVPSGESPGANAPDLGTKPNEPSGQVSVPPTSETSDGSQGTKESWMDYKAGVPFKPTQVYSFQSPSIVRIKDDFVRQNGSLPGLRPRIFARKSDFERIQKLLAEKDPFLKKVEALFKERADVALVSKLPPYELSSRGVLEAVHQMQENLAALLIMYRIRGETRYGLKAIDYLSHLSEFPSWNHEKHFLDVGIAAYLVGFTFDWTYDLMQEPQKRKFAEAIYTKAILPGLQQFDKGAFWYNDPNNWNPICSGGLITAALAILGQNSQWESQLLKTMVLGINSLPSYVRSLEPDGASVEGLMYWAYGMSNFIRVAETLKSALGTDYGLTNSLGLERSGRFPLAMSGPVAGLTLGDDSLKTAPSDTFFWFGSRFKDRGLSYLRQRNIESYALNRGKIPDNLWWDLFFYQRSVLEANPVLQKNYFDDYVRGAELVAFRSDPVDPKALFIAVTNTPNSASHSHLACGSFFIQADGEVWALGGLGAEDYRFPGYFMPTKPDYLDSMSDIKAPGRFHMYRLRAEGKNTLVLNPDVRPDQNPKGKPVIQKIRSDKDSATLVTDLGSCYDRDAQSVKRGVRLVQGRSLVQISDVIKPLKKSRIIWSMHTPAEITLGNDGRTALLTLGSKRFAVQSFHDKARFKVTKAQYLDDRKFPMSQNSPVTYNGREVKKLILEIEGDKGQTLELQVSMALFGSQQSSIALKASEPLELW